MLHVTYVRQTDLFAVTALVGAGEEPLRVIAAVADVEADVVGVDASHGSGPVSDDVDGEGTRRSLDPLSMIDHGSPVKK